MRAFPRRTLGTALVAALATTGLAGAAYAAPQPGPPAPGSGGAKAGQESAPFTGAAADKLKRQDALLPVARNLAAQARSASSDIAGVSIDPDSGTVHLYRTDTGRPLGLGGKPAGVKVAVHAAKFSRQDMNNAANARAG